MEEVKETENGIIGLNETFKEILNAFSMIPETISKIEDQKIKNYYTKYYEECLQYLYDNDSYFNVTVNDIVEEYQRGL